MNVNKENLSSLDTERTASDYFDNEYKEYAIYTIEERALPSVIDGLKPGARKIVHAALETLDTVKKQKMTNLVGETYKLSAYHHGPVSLDNTMCTLSAFYSDTLAPLQAYGKFGTLRHNGFAAARYLTVTLSQFTRIFQQDMEILEYNYDGLDRIEPKHYLPVIPPILAKRTSGIALGYAFTSSCSYNPLSIIEASLKAIDNNNKVDKVSLKPYVEGYKGLWKKLEDGRIMSVGKYTIVKDTVVIEEFNVDETYSNIEKRFNDLQDKNIITKWKREESSKGKSINYSVTLPKDILQKWQEKGSLEWNLGISKILEKPNYTVLNEFNKPVKFETPEDLLEYFINYRLSKYDKSKAQKISAIEQRIVEANYIRKFIDLYLQGKIVLNKDTAMSIVKSKLDDYELPHSVLQTAISKLTKDEYDKLSKEILTLEEKLTYVKSTSITQMYKDDLIQLKESFKGMFNEN